MDTFDRALQSMRADALTEREMRPTPNPALEAVIRAKAVELGLLPAVPFEADCGV